MKTFDFYPTLFRNIPHQDNPAFGNEECLMIVSNDANRGNDVVVLRITPDPIESVKHTAKFWRHDYAVTFCENFNPE